MTFTGYDPYYIAMSLPANAPVPDLVFYVYDHLGNTRVTYSTDALCSGSIEYTLEVVKDYYPYGKILREYVNGEDEKYISTQHQRDQETGLDYRGARFYDGDIARFLSLDPLAADFPDWSDYNYVLGNPLVYTDPDGKAPKDIIVLIITKGASGYGHMAVLIGDDKKGWTFVSKGGRADTNGDGDQDGNMLSGGNSVQVIEEFASLEEALSHKEVKKYDKGLRYETTQKEDQKATEAAKKSSKTKYNVISNNCADTCSDALESIGKLGGGTQDRKGGFKKVKSSVPNVRYEQIKGNWDKKKEVVLKK